jgi:hypothetical protein
MKNSFNDFKLKVQHYCIPEDFSKNNKMLENLPVSSYETFITLLKLGGQIEMSVKACDEISKLSTTTHLTEPELIELSTRFRFINGLIDERHF